MKKVLFLCIAVVFVTMSCQKEYESRTIVQGRVLEENSQKPVAFARVRLLTGGTAFLSNAAPNTTDEVIADANGFYSMEFDFQKGSWYEVLPIDPKKDPKKKYFEAQSVGVPFNPGETINLDCALTPYAYLKLKVKNVSGATGFSASASYTLDGKRYELYGTNVDTTLFGSRAANKPNSQIVYVVTKSNGVDEVFRIQQSFPAHDTIIYNVNY